MTPKLTPKDANKTEQMEPAIREIKKHGNTRWEVDFGVDATGTKTRKIVETEDEAKHEIEVYRKPVKSRGEWWARMSELELASVQLVYKQVQAAGLTLTRVWEDHQRWRKENAQTAIEPMSYAKAVDKWKDRKLAAGKSEEYVKEVGALLMRFGKGQEKR